MTKKLDTMEQRVTQCCEDFVLPLSRIWYLKSWSSAILHMLKIAADNKLWLADIIRKLKMLNFIRNWPQLAEFKKGSEGIIAAVAVGCQSRWSGFRSTLLSRVTASRAGLGREIIKCRVISFLCYFNSKWGWNWDFANVLDILLHHTRFMELSRTRPSVEMNDKLPIQVFNGMVLNLNFLKNLPTSALNTRALRLLFCLC